jgi:hypothetical protein
MIQCTDCEYYGGSPDGKVVLLCDPFTNIKEPECLIKWQLLKLDAMVQAYSATVDMYRRLAPLQERMFRHLERELDDADEADAWKQDPDDEEEDDEFLR